MTDQVTLGFAVVNTILALTGIIMTLYAQNYFKGGLLAKTARRGTVVVTLLFLHFFIDLLEDIGAYATPAFVGHFLEFGFTVALTYVAYALVKDWQNFGKISAV